MAHMMNSAAASKGNEKGKGWTQTVTGTSWTCPNCRAHVFRRNSQCHKCGEQRPDEFEEARGQKRKFDDSQSASWQQQKKKACSVFAKTGICKWGDKCYNSHELQWS